MELYTQKIQRGDELNIKIEFKSIWVVALMVILCVVFSLYLQVTLNSPITFGDEGFHTRMAQWMAENKEYPVWVPFEGSDVGRSGFTRPPLFALLEAGLLIIFNNIVVLKIFTPLLAILAGLSTYFLVKRICNQRAAFFAAVILIMLPSFVTYSVLLYLDILFTLLFSLFAFTFIIGASQENKKYLLLAGIFGGLAILTKVVGYSAFLLLLTAFIYQLYKKRDWRLIKTYLYVGIPLILIISPYLVRNLVYYHTPECVLPFFDNSGCEQILEEFEPKYEFSGRTESVGTEMSVLSMGFINYLNFAYGGYLKIPYAESYMPFTIPILLAGLLLLAFNRDETNIMLLLSLFSLSLLFILNPFGRAEDAARFTLAWTPIIAAICGVYLDKICTVAKKYQNYLTLVVVVLVLYVGFLQTVEKLDVMNGVKRFSDQFFIACDWIKINVPEDALISTLWTHRTTYSAQRNVIGMDADIRLSRDVDYTLSVAKTFGATHLFIQKFSLYGDSSLSERYGVDFVQFLEDNPEHFKKVYENGPELQQCIQQGGCDGTILYEVVY